MNKNILVTGSLAFDLIMEFPGSFEDSIDPTKLHIMSVSFLVDTLKKERGGNSGNISYTLSLLDQKPFILTAAGNDFTDYANFLTQHNVNLNYIKIIPDEVTATAMIITDKKNNQISAFYPGAMKHTNTLSLKAIQKPDFVVITPDTPEAMIKFATECKELGLPYMFDPGMQLPALDNESLLKGIDGAQILIGNDYEMGIIKKRLELEEEGLLNKVKILIITLGELGSLVKTTSGELRINPAKPTEIIDPTGAGDNFRAGFLAGYLNGQNLKTSGQMGSVASCYAIEKYGTTNHSFTLDEFKARYKENFGEELNF